ncbi:MAG TPA: hypothetical protein V6D26_00035 [Stenomitos sp.]
MDEERKAFLRTIWAKYKPEAWYGLFKEGQITSNEFIFLWRQKVKSEDKTIEQVAKDFGGEVVS